MEYNKGKFLFIFVAAGLLSCLVAWLITHLYRRALRGQMRIPVFAEGLAPPRKVTIADSYRAARRLTALLIGVSCLLAVTSASMWMSLAFPDEPFLPKRVLVVALLNLWPIIPSLILVWHWSRWRMIATFLLWLVVWYFIFLWRSVEPQPLQLLSLMIVEMGPSVLLVAIIFLGNTTRAVAPWFLFPFIGLAWASLTVYGVVSALASREESGTVLQLLSEGEPFVKMAFFALLLSVLAWGTLYRFFRVLARAYSQKFISDVLMVFSAVWGISLLDKTLSVASSAGVVALAMFLPLLSVPLVMLPYSRLSVPQGRPPTLLVLRVFQRDAQVQELFDHVIERWRLIGNTVMIAGTDLASRTLNADDIFTFIDGRLARRFIRTSADVPSRLAEFDMEPDIDGRHRVNQCYCHDTTWQQTLQVLVERSDVVLMDLRGFTELNAGCCFELASLAQATHPLHVVVLTDAHTDRAAARQLTAGDHSGRFVWLDATCLNAQMRQKVLARLFDYQPMTSPPQNVVSRPIG